VNPSACALIAQIVPVFLLVFAVRDSTIARAVAEDAKNRTGQVKRQRMRSDLRSGWIAVISLFLVFEFILVLGAAELMAVSTWIVIPMFAVILVYAAIEFWAGAGPSPTANDSTDTSRE
jgi:hypothetical protein